MRFAVVYYTRFGHTRTLAQQLAQELGAELRQIWGQRGPPRVEEAPQIH